VNWLKKFWQSLTTPQTTPANPGGMNMEAMNNYTPRAQQVLALARKQADRFNHNFVGTEHLLLGIVALGQGTAYTVLRKMGIDPETVRMEVERQVGTGPDEKMTGNIPYTPRVKKVLMLAAKEARSFSHTYVGTEHILLGLLREDDGVAARVLKNLHVDIEQTRHEVLQALDPNRTPAELLDVPTQPPPPRPPVSTTYVKLEQKPKTQPEPIDVSKRYDVYCNEQSGFAVYRNVRFKELRSLFRKGDFDFAYDYIEIEEANGHTFFIPRSSIVKFCEHGGAAGEGSDSSKAQ
jgi:hypothetical protein